MVRAVLLATHFLSISEQDVNESNVTRAWDTLATAAYNYNPSLALAAAPHLIEDLEGSVGLPRSICYLETP